VNEFFTSYDNTHFENRKLSALIDNQDPFGGIFIQKNRFNKNLMSDIKTAESNNSAGKSSSGLHYQRQEINHVDPLFGAI
jgi:hypothetical protein